MDNLNDLPKMFETGMRFTLGAGNAVVESVQDFSKVEATLNRLQTDFDGLSQEWVEKGTQTEEEARQFVETILAQSGIPVPPGSTSASSATVTTTATPVPTTLQDDIKDLTSQIVELRQTLTAHLESETSAGS